MPLTTHIIYFENAVGRISEHAEGYAVVQYKPGKRVLHEFQSFLTHLTHLLHRRGWYKVLTDQRAMSSFTEDERQWIRERWIAPVTEGQQETMAAVLLPHDVFARLASNQVMHDARTGTLVYHIFENEVEAAAWLMQAS
jgi:hypothetical protein